MKIAAILIGLGGLLLGTVLVAYFGAGAVIDAFTTIGWGGFFALCLYQLAMTAINGLAWYALIPGQKRRLIPQFMAARLVRDSGSEILPILPVGGFIMGARVANLAGVPASTTAASTIVDVTMELMGQLAFTTIGLVLLIWLQPKSTLIYPIGIGLIIAVAVATGFILAQKRGLFLVVERLAGRLAKEWSGPFAMTAAKLQENTDEIYRHRRNVWFGFSLHFSSWILGIGQAWLVLHLIGSPLGFSALLVIESLVFAARSVAFMVPNALGVQEGSYIMLSALFGLSPEIALALSLLKRARDLAIGIPALFVWQFIEGSRWLQRRSVPKPKPGDASE